MKLEKDQIIEVDVKTRRGSDRWIGQVIKVTPTRCQYYYMRQHLMGFAMIRRWAKLEDVHPATRKNKERWKTAQQENRKLAEAYRDAALSDIEPMPLEASKALRMLVKGYASSL